MCFTSIIDGIKAEWHRYWHTSQMTEAAQRRRYASMAGSPSSDSVD